MTSAGSCGSSGRPTATWSSTRPGKANGRGAYLCATPECFETARQRRRLDSALKVSLKDDDYDRLRRDFDELLRLGCALAGRTVTRCPQ